MAGTDYLNRAASVPTEKNLSAYTGAALRKGVFLRRIVRLILPSGFDPAVDKYNIPLRHLALRLVIVVSKPYI